MGFKLARVVCVKQGPQEGSGVVPFLNKCLIITKINATVVTLFAMLKLLIKNKRVKLNETECNTLNISLINIY